MLCWWEHTWALRFVLSVFCLGRRFITVSSFVCLFVFFFFVCEKQYRVGLATCLPYLCFDALSFYWNSCFPIKCTVAEGVSIPFISWVCHVIFFNGLTRNICLFSLSLFWCIVSLKFIFSYKVHCFTMDWPVPGALTFNSLAVSNLALYGRM